MKTINASSKGADFIRDINDNFAECVDGGDGAVAVKVSMQGGELKASTGYVDGRWCADGASNGVGTWTDDDFYKYLHTPCYLSLKGNKVKRVTVPTGSTLSIFCYDDTFALISSGVVNDEDNIPASTSYVKMQFYSPSGYPQVIALDMVLTAAPQWVKNTGAAYSQQWFNYDCKPPKLWDDANYTTPHVSPVDGSVDMDNTRYHDNGVVILPPNYSAMGKPCKVVLWTNGDITPWFIMHDAFHAKDGGSTIYEQNFKYLCNQGYAVAMFTGYTSMWHGETGATDTNEWTPRMSQATIASTTAFYDHIMRNYNFDPMLYVAGKSAGGYLTLYLAANRPFPVRAAAGFSIICSMADRLVENPLKFQKPQQKRMGCANWDSFVLNATDYGASGDGTRASIKPGATSQQKDDAELLQANVDIYRNLDQFTAMSDIDYADYLDAVLVYDPFEDEEPPQVLTDILDNSHKSMATPVKLWCATKDPSTPYAWHKIYVDWVSKNNGTAILRSYTGDVVSGGSQHHVFCGGVANGGKVAYNLPTPYGGTMNGVNIGIVEAVEWFNRW